MKERIQHLARQSAFYSIGNVAVKLGGLVLAPVLLNPEYLDVASYGYLALLLVTAQLGVFVVGLGISSGLLRFWTHKDYRERRSDLASTAFVICLLLAVLIPGAVFLTLSEDIAMLLLDDTAKGEIVGLVLVYVGFKIVGGVPLTMFRVQERPLAYGATQAFEMLVLVGLCLYWLVFLGKGLEGVVQAYAAAAGITATLSCLFVFVPMKWSLDVSIVRPLIAFGAPLALASLSVWILNSSDRYLLKWLSDTTVVAAYDWASRVAGVISVLLVQSFQLAFVVVGFRRLDQNDVTLHREMFRHYVVWTGWAILGLSVFTGDAMELMAYVFNVDQKYVDISVLVLLVGVGFWAYGVNQIVVSVLTSAGKTGVIAFTVALAAIANVALNLLMIPEFGGAGAAFATAMAFVLMTGLATVFAENWRRVGYSWALAANALVLVIILFWLGTLGQDWSLAARIALRFGVVAGYMPLLVLTKSYGYSEFKGGIGTLLSIVRLRDISGNRPG